MGWKRSDLGDDSSSDWREVAGIEISLRYTKRKKAATNFRKARAKGRAKESEEVFTRSWFQNLHAV